MRSVRKTEQGMEMDHYGLRQGGDGYIFDKFLTGASISFCACYIRRF